MKNAIYTFLFFISATMNSFSQTNYDKLINEGLELLKQENIPAAIVKYQQAYKLDSTRVEANYGLGAAYQYLCQRTGKECHNALKHLNKSIAIDDQYRKGYYNRAGCKVMLKDYKGAIPDFDKAILKDPNNETYYVARGTTYLKLNLRTKACEDLNKAAKLGSEIAKKLLVSQNCQ